MIIKKRSDGCNVAAPATVLIAGPISPTGFIAYQVDWEALAMRETLLPVPLTTASTSEYSVSPEAAESVVGKAVRLKTVKGIPSPHPGVVPGVPGAVGPTWLIFGKTTLPPAARDCNSKPGVEIKFGPTPSVQVVRVLSRVL